MAYQLLAVEFVTQQKSYMTYCYKVMTKINQNTALLWAIPKSISD